MESRLFVDQSISPGVVVSITGILIQPEHYRRVWPRATVNAVENTLACGDESTWAASGSHLKQDGGMIISICCRTVSPQFGVNCDVLFVLFEIYLSDCFCQTRRDLK